MSSQAKSHLLVCCAVLMWSTVATAFKLALDVWQIVPLLFYASLISTVIFLLANKFSKQSLWDVNAKKLSHSFLLGFLNPFLYYVILFVAYSKLPAQIAQPLNWTWPIVLGLFTTLVRQRRIELNWLIAALVSFTGVLFISSGNVSISNENINLFGAVLAVGSSLVWALYWTANVLDDRSPTVKLFWNFLFATILSGLLCLFLGQFFIPDARQLILVSWIAIFEMGLTFIVWMTALTMAKNRAIASLWAYFTPFVSLIFIALVLNERIVLHSVLGLSLIVCGIVIGQFGRSKAI